jgi:hypothetical protein
MTQGKRVERPVELAALTGKVLVRPISGETTHRTLAGSGFAQGRQS